MFLNLFSFKFNKYNIYCFIIDKAGCQTMNVANRRAAILSLLKDSASPIPGDELAKHFAVSRQIIVQDIAVLKAADYNILSTNRGYFLYSAQNNINSRTFKVSHTDEQIKEELYCIVDLGGYVKNVIVYHEVYGNITAELNISSRRDADAFIKKVKSSNSVPLKVLGSDIHSHKVNAASEEILDEIEAALKNKGILLNN